MLLSNAATPEAVSQLVMELCSRIPLAGFFDYRDQLKKMGQDVWSELLEKSENEDRSSRRKFETDSYLFELGVTYYPREGQPPRLWIYRTINGFSDRWSKVSSKIEHTGYAVRVTPQDKLDELRKKLFPAMQLTGYWKNAATWQLCVLSSENNQTTFYHAVTRWPVVIRRNFNSDPDRWSEIRVEYSSKKPKDDGSFAFIQGLKSIRWYGVEDEMPNYIEFWKRPNSFSTEILEIEKRRESIDEMMIDTIRFRPKK